MANFRVRAFAVWSVFFLVCCVSQTVHEQRFRDSQLLTPPVNNVTLGDPDNFSFAMVGDLHIAGADTSRLRKILDSAAAEGCSFFLPLGDLVDQGVRSDVVAFRTALSDLGWEGRAFPVIGNHDVFAAGWDHYRELNGPSVYTFTVGNSKFIVLDTADGSLGEGQYRWLENELSAARPKNLFLASHYLPLIPGIQTYLKLSNDVESLKLMKLAKSHGVTAWLGAHYHSYVVGGVDEVTYVTAGGGGGRRMHPVTDFFYVKATVSPGQVDYRMIKVD